MERRGLWRGGEGLHIKMKGGPVGSGHGDGD